MYGPTVPPVRPRGQSSELRQYSISEWNAEPAFLINETERERTIRRAKDKEGRIKKQVVRAFHRILDLVHKKTSHPHRSGHKYRGVR
jgi:hypothetical protein